MGYLFIIQGWSQASADGYPCLHRGGVRNAGARQDVHKHRGSREDGVPERVCCPAVRTLIQTNKVGPHSHTWVSQVQSWWIRIMRNEDMTYCGIWNSEKETKQNFIIWSALVVVPILIGPILTILMELVVYICKKCSKVVMSESLHLTSIGNII